jgi:hypothetical protein
VGVQPTQADTSNEDDTSRLLSLFTRAFEARCASPLSHRKKSGQFWKPSCLSDKGGWRNPYSVFCLDQLTGCATPDIVEELHPHSPFCLTKKTFYNPTFTPASLVRALHVQVKLHDTCIGSRDKLSVFDAESVDSKDVSVCDFAIERRDSENSTVQIQRHSKHHHDVASVGNTNPIPPKRGPRSTKRTRICRFAYQFQFYGPTRGLCRTSTPQNEAAH